MAGDPRTRYLAHLLEKVCTELLVTTAFAGKMVFSPSAESDYLLIALSLDSSTCPSLIREQQMSQ
jgi:hypothetical protein